MMSLPTWFFEPAPLRRPGVLAADVEKRFWRSRAATLTLMRAAALIVGLGMIATLLVGRGRWTLVVEPAAWDLTRFDVWMGLTLAVSALMVIVVALRNQESWYIPVFRFTGGAYFIALTCHVLGLLRGSSVLEELHLADFAGYPVILLLLSLPRWLSIPVAILTMGAASGSHQGLPPTGSSLVEAGWGFLIVLPYLLLVLSALRTTKEIDQEATRQHTEALRRARSTSLLNAETHFLGYLHDWVLHHLNGIRRRLVAPEPLPVRFPTDMMQVATPLPIRIDRAVFELAQILRRVDPELHMTLPDDLSATASVPADTLSLISDAAVEAVGNSVRHAGRATREAEISVETDSAHQCRALTVTLRDNGPGFDLEGIAPERAGVRVSILGRMASAPGLFGDVDSAPGRGTRVHLNWQRPETAENPVLPEKTSTLIEKGFDIGQFFNPLFGVYAFLIFLFMGLGHDHSGSEGPFITALVFLGLAVTGVIHGRANRLSWPWTLWVVGSGYAFVCLAAYEQIGLSAGWPQVWYVPIFVFMCVVLAMRDRALTAWLLLAIGVLTIIWVEQDAAVIDYVSAEYVVSIAILMVPGTLIPLALRCVLKGLTSVLLEDSCKKTDLAVAATRRSYISDCVDWIEKQLSAVLDPELPEELRIYGAHLLELQLRDAIRSPGFDEEETNRQVWQARHRGTIVRLSDDRSNEHGIDPSPLPGAHAEMHHRLRESLNNAEIAVTARMVPPGRDTYATILVESVGEDGQPVVERIRIASSEVSSSGGTGGGVQTSPLPGR